MPAPQASVLVVDDDAAVGKVVCALLAQAGIAAQCARSGAAALEILAVHPIDVLVADLRMPGMDGMELVSRVGAEWPGVPVILLTAHGTVPLAVEAMKRGAADFVLKPFDREELLFAVTKALSRARHAEEHEPASRRPIAGLLGDSTLMRECRALIARAATGKATVLLRGESGTGKELAARAIHDESPRHAGPFVKIHCAALPDNLLESELFGYEKGAFTGAVARKQGRVELAQGGTLFLDEIGDITPAVQVKLLRLLQEREFERLGGMQTLKADVRFVAATHRDLDAMVARGEFRGDLFYRLNVVPLWLPSLRDRREDIEPLATHFSAELAAENNRPQVRLDEEALALLSVQPWPGNVRQLQNFIERLVVLSEQPLIGAASVERELTQKLPGPNASPSKPPSATESGPARLDDRRRDAEREALEMALRKAKNNRALAARILGVSRRTLYNKLEEHKLL